MRRAQQLRLGLLLTSVIVFLTAGSVASSEPNVIRAEAVVVGNGVEGHVWFTESPVDKYTPVSEVKVVAHIKGLTPGLHGFHVHENGTCDPPAYLTAGAHFDPGPFGNSVPVDANHPYHLGDLPNLEANAGGVAHVEFETSRFTLRQNAGNLLSIFDANGSAIIVHQNPDLGANGVPGASGGPRVACGVIRPE